MTDLICVGNNSVNGLSKIVKMKNWFGTMCMHNIHSESYTFSIGTSSSIIVIVWEAM